MNDETFIITRIDALEILDSRGNPTVRACVSTGYMKACADAPAGASKGIHEAVELRNGGNRLSGKGVRKAVFTIENIIAQALVGLDIRDQVLIDKTLIELDGTSNKSKLGGNSTISVSLATARLAAGLLEMPLYRYISGLKKFVLPVPFMNIINGGKHAGNNLAIQEFMIVPLEADCFSEALWMGVEVYHKLKKIIKEEYGAEATGLGDEGGFAPPIDRTREALKLLDKAVIEAGYVPGEDIYFALDSAASNFYDKSKEKYIIDELELGSGDLLNYYDELTNEYPIISIEDPFFEEDFEAYSELTNKLRKKKAIVVGDDLLTTNVERLALAMSKNAVSGVLVKPNQIGTLTETIEFVSEAVSHGLKAIVSHRSGDTEDDFIADLVVGLSTGAIKTGAPARGERISKYNRLLEIEKELGTLGEFIGKKFLQ